MYRVKQGRLLLLVAIGAVLVVGGGFYFLAVAKSLGLEVGRETMMTCDMGIAAAKAARGAAPITAPLVLRGVSEVSSRTLVNNSG